VVLAENVGEAQVDELDFLVLDQVQHFGSGRHTNLEWVWGGMLLAIAVPAAAPYEGRAGPGSRIIDPQDDMHAFAPHECK